MRRWILLVMVSMFGSPASSGTGGTEASEPVNVIIETGRDVGRCDDGASLSYPPPPYKGSAYFLLRVDPDFAAQHGDLTKQQAVWLHRLAGPSGANRLFTAANGDRAIVFWSCKAGDCGENIAYGAYGLQPKAYLIELREGTNHRALGTAAASLAAAIACARAQDEVLRRHTAEQLKKQPGR